MKILFLVPSLNKGGAEVVVTDLARELQKQGNTVEILAFMKGRYDTFNINAATKLVPIKFILNLKSFDFVLINALCKILLYLMAPLVSLCMSYNFTLKKYDIVHVNMTICSYYLPFLKFWSVLFGGKVKYVETFHTNWNLLKIYNKLINIISWSAADAVVWEIGLNEGSVIRKKSLQKNIYYIPFGIDSEVKPNIAKQEFFKNTWNLDRSKINIMTMSRLKIFEKKIDIMLEVVAKLIEYGYSDYQLFLVGDGSDRFKIEEIAKNLKIRDNVTITGYMDDPISIISLCDIYFVAMAYEDTGVSGLQAGFVNSACIGFQAIPDYQAKDSYFFSGNNSELIAKKIIKLRDNSYLEKYRCKFNNHVKNERTLLGFARKYQIVFNNVKKQN